MKKNIPDAITCLNLLSGCYALIFVFSGNLEYASYMVFLAMIFDFFDGFAARMLQVNSGIGKQLDSLADVISFGLVPSFMLYHMIKVIFENSDESYSPFLVALVLMSPFMLVVASALRLARFNVDVEQSVVFKGLPTPASAMFVVALPFFGHSKLFDLEWIITNPYYLVLISIFLSFMMISSFRLISLKFTEFSWTKNSMRYILIGGAALLIFFFGFASLSFIVLLYLLISFVDTRISNTNNS